MSNTNIVAAIVLGSSKITGIVGTKEIDGTIRVKSHVSQTSSDFIGKGRVLNVEKMANCLVGIKSQLEEMASCKIKCYYAAINCLGLRSTINEVSKHFPDSELVTDEFLTSIAVQNREGKPNGREILDAIPLEYRLGSKATTVTHEPKGMQTDHIHAKFLNIICNSNTIATIKSCFRKAGMELAGGRLHIGVQHLASVVTTEQERTTGCVVVDMGSETTTVAVYRGKLLQHLVVIPLGSNSITHDIENVFYVERDEAEQLKRNYGYPTSDKEDDKEEFSLRDGGRVKKYSELANIIDARVEEIVQNVKHQIELSQLGHEKIVNGIYLCGGGAQMTNIISAFKNHFEGWNVRIIKNASRLTIACAERNFNELGNFNTALGLIDNAEINCYGGEYQGIFNDDEVVIEEVTETNAEEEARLAEEARIAEEAARREAEEAAAEAARIKAEEEANKQKGGKFGSMLKSFSKKLADLVKDDDV